MKKSKKGLLFNVEERTKERIKVLLVSELRTGGHNVEAVNKELLQICTLLPKVDPDPAKVSFIHADGIREAASYRIFRC